MSKHLSFKVIVFFCLFGFSLSAALYSQQKVRVIKKDAELKTLPQVESLTIVGLPLGGEYTITEKASEGWVKISLPPDKDGIVQSGYVQAYYVELVDATADRNKKGLGLSDIFRVGGLSGLFHDTPKEIDPNVTTDEKFIIWQSEYSAAKSRRATWRLIGWMAVFLSFDVVIIPSLLELRGAWPKVSRIGFIAGSAVALVGFVLAGSANRHVKALESEGTARRYFKLSAGLLPKYRSIGIQVAFGF